MGSAGGSSSCVMWGLVCLGSWCSGSSTARRSSSKVLELAVGFDLNVLDWIITATFVLIALSSVVVLLLTPTLDNSTKAALAIMSAISFVGIAHLWPWYLVWTVLLAALVPRWWLARFVIGV